MRHRFFWTHPVKAGSWIPRGRSPRLQRYCHHDNLGTRRERGPFALSGAGPNAASLRVAVGAVPLDGVLQRELGRARRETQLLLRLLRGKPHVVLGHLDGVKRRNVIRCLKSCVRLRTTDIAVVLATATPSGKRSGGIDIYGPA